jgi:hypothetical protein
VRIISFAWTAAAFEPGVKSVTRRRWNDHYARSFQAGDLLQAWDKVPFAGGKRIGTIRLTKAPYKQAWRDVPDEHYWFEGFAHLNGLPEGKWGWVRAAAQVPLTWGEFERWRNRDGECWVVEFEKLDWPFERQVRAATEEGE